MTGAELFFACGFVALILAVWRHSTTESESVRLLNQRVDGMQEMLNQVRDQAKRTLEHVEERKAKVDAFAENVVTLTARVHELQAEVDAAQDHLVKVREGMVELRDRSYPRSVEITWKPTGPIQFEILPTTPKPAPAKLTPARAQKLLKKTAKQIRDLSK